MYWRPSSPSQHGAAGRAREQRSGPWLARTAALVVLAGLAAGCPRPIPLPDPEPGEAPLERALRITGRDLDAVQLPDAESAGYFIPTRSPVIDRALERPLALAPFGDRLALQLDQASTPSALLEALAPVSPGGNTEVETETSTAVESQAVPSLPSPTEALRSEQGQLVTAHLPEGFRAVFVELVAAAEAAHEAWEALQRSGPPLHRTAEDYFVDSSGRALRFGSHPVGVQLEFLRAAEGLDYRAMAAQAAQLSGAVEELIPRLLDERESLPAASSYLLHLETSLGRVMIGSPGADRHDLDAFVLVDPGGSDLWANNAGSNVGPTSSVSVAIDLAGVDRYECTRPHCQGAGFRGLGMLVDAGPEGDQYLAGNQAQGAGFMGVGIAWDMGGDDARQAESFAQGAGTFGLGLLLDSGGNDRGAVAARGQGFGSTAGLGVYVDSEGADQLRLGIPGEGIHSRLGGGGQGAGWGTRPYPWVGDASLHGGVGLLYDRAGDDSYYARAFGQGSGSMLGLGMLLDRGGNDRYLAEWHGQGSGYHLAAGLLLDSEGNDTYTGTHSTQGAALDRSVGVLWDRGSGQDVHSVGVVGGAIQREIGGGIAWSRQTRALALLVDSGGDDTYSVPGDGLGFVVPPERPDRAGLAVLADLGGSDSYSLGLHRAGANPTEGATWLHEKHGVGMDTASSRPGWDPRPLEPQGGFGAFSWSGEASPSAPLPEPGEGDLEGDSTQRWLAMEALYRRALAGEELEPLPPAVRSAALSDPSSPVRRAAARVLVTQGEMDGVDVLVDSLVYRSEENWDHASHGTLRFWLQLLTGVEATTSAEDWRRDWRALRDELDLEASWALVAAVERGQRASGRRDLDGLVQSCSEAIALPGGERARATCATLVGLWTWVLSDPESHLHHDPQRAVELGQLAVQWAPDQPEHFVNLGRAFWLLGELELAQRALAKAEVLDPDDAEFLTLRKQLEDGPAPEVPASPSAPPSTAEGAQADPPQSTD